jgi:alpha-tubulin suppressor-like RCC1 family protein
VAWCWGADTYGSPSLEYSPIAVAGGLTFSTLTASNMHTCGVDTAGTAWCWGDNFWGSLGGGNVEQASGYSPIAVAGGHTLTTLTAGGTHTCGVDTTGKAWCWGWDGFGQVGDGDEYVY